MADSDTNNKNSYMMRYVLNMSALNGYYRKKFQP